MNSSPYQKLLQYFLQGLLILAPVSITLYFIYVIFDKVDSILRPVINIPGIGFIIILGFVLIVGYLSSFFFISRILSLFNKLKAYKLQEEGKDTVEANLALGFKNDQRDYGVGAQILRHLGVTKLKLMTNNPRKRAGLLGYGLEVVSTIPIEIRSNPHNERYLATKRDKMGHDILNKG